MQREQYKKNTETENRQLVRRGCDVKRNYFKNIKIVLNKMRKESVTP